MLKETRSLIQMVKSRTSTRFGHGITTADRFASSIVDCVGAGVCKRYFGSSGGFDSGRMLKEAGEKLTYSGDDLVIEKTATSELEIRKELGDGGELPAHTMMLIKHVLTTPREDRDTDVLETAGAIPDPKMPLLWQHIHTLPIGKLFKILHHDEHVLRMATVLIDLNDLTSDAAKLVEADALRFSHGFRALKFTEMAKGFRVLQFEIMEESLVSVPSNVDAEIELWSRNKLKSDAFKAHAKALDSMRVKSYSVGRKAGEIVVKAASFADLKEAMDRGLIGASEVAETAGPALVRRDSCECGGSCSCGEPEASPEPVVDDQPADTAAVEPEAKSYERGATVKLGGEQGTISQVQNGPVYGVTINGTESKWHLESELTLVQGSDNGGYGEANLASATPRSKSMAGGVYRKMFDPATERLEPCSTEIDWAARYIGCGVKDLSLLSTQCGGIMRGGFLDSFDQMLAGSKIAETRNMSNGTERPPEYEAVDISSQRRSTYLTEGFRFMASPDGWKFAYRTSEYWGTQHFVIYSEDREKAQALIDRTWAKLEQDNPLKGEAFQLTGGFLKRNGLDWNEIFLDEKNEKGLKRIVRIVNDKGADAANRGVILQGPPGCLHGDTPIVDPVDGSSYTVRQRHESQKPFHVWALSKDGRIVVAPVERAWKYEPADMLRFTFASGRQITVTKGHKFWNGTSYVSSQSIAEGHRESGACHLPSISEHDLLALTKDALRSTRTPPGYPENCSADFCLDDARLPLEVGSDRGPLLRRADARRHSRPWSRQDGKAATNSDSLSASSHRHPSTDCTYQPAPRFGNESQFLSREASGEYAGGLCALVSQPNQSTYQIGSEKAFAQSGQSSKLPLRGLHVCVGRSSEYTASDKIVTVKEVGVHQYYDFHVPVHNSYWAEGYFHHNTGKTLGSRVIMNQANATYIWVAAKDFYNAGSYGCFSATFDLARKLAPAIILFEDVDNYITDYTVDLLKSEMDGLAQSSGVITLLTTNFPEKIPAALIDRPGRFHDVLEFGLPSKEIRRTMLEKWATGASMDAVCDIAEKTDGLSGAHVFELAAFAKTIRDEDEVEMDVALVAALAKVHEQRELINQNQLSGSGYRQGRRNTLTVTKDLLQDSPFMLAESSNKAGRTISQRNLSRLQEVHDTLDDMETMKDLAPRAAKTLAKSAKAVCKAMMEECQPEESSSEDSGKTITLDECFSKLLASGDHKLLKRIHDASKMILDVAAADAKGEAFRKMTRRSK